jgi:hypothetical protein
LAKSIDNPSQGAEARARQTAGSSPAVRPGAAGDSSLFYAALLIVFLVVVACLALQGLDNAVFWDDEAHVGIIARNWLKTGHFTGWDGRNMYSLRGMLALDENFEIRQPPLDYLTAAGSFAAFGETTWAGRLPFAIAGLLALAVFVFVLRDEFGGERLLQGYILAMLGFSTFFLVYIRQCRYYGLTLLFALVVFWAYRRCVKRQKPGYFVALAVAAGLLFYSQFLLCATFMLSLAITHFIFHRREWGRRQWWYAAMSAGIFIVGTAPYAIKHHVWERPDIPVTLPWYFQKPSLLWINVRDLNATAPFSWLMAIVLIALLARYRKTLPEMAVIARWAAFAGVLILMTALLSPQPADGAPDADLRYLFPIAPFLAGLAGGLLWMIHGASRRWGGVAAGLVMCVALCSNALALTPLQMKLQWRLPAYFGEISRPYPTAAMAVTQYLRAHAKQDDIVLAHPSFNEAPLMFYLGDKLRFCAYVDTKVPRDFEQLKRMGIPSATEDFPNWFISYGWEHKSQQILDSFSRPLPMEPGKPVMHFGYTQIVLNVFLKETQRPEDHRFAPITEFAPEHGFAVYVYRRTAKPVPQSGGQ